MYPSSCVAAGKANSLTLAIENPAADLRFPSSPSQERVHRGSRKAFNDDLDSLAGIHGVSGQIMPEDMEEFVDTCWHDTEI
jgi:hypothetical protein